MLEWGMKLAFCATVAPHHLLAAVEPTGVFFIPCFVAVAAAVLLIILVALAFVFK